MKTIKNILPLFLLATLFLGLSACKKKCVVETEDTNNGSIVSGVVFYPSAGNLTPSMGGNYVIDATHPYADEFQIRFNDGEKIDVNYSNYTILCYPTTANCSAAYDRTVTIDDANQTVVYKIVVTQCENCPEKYLTENYVLVPAFPSSYAVSYDVSYVTK
jgi:hypothetical protein